jgi:hypothetical protein
MTNLPPIVVDFETFYSSKLKYSVAGKYGMIAEQYCRHPLFDPYMISACDGAGVWAGDPRKDFDWSTLNGRDLLSHNAYFDRNVQAEMVRRGWAPPITPRSWHCTANMTSYICNRRALKDAMGHLLGVKVSKQVRSEANNRQWATYSEAEKEAMINYAKADALEPWQLWQKFSPQWPDWERRLSDLSIKQAMRGVQIDTELLEQFIVQTHEMRRNAEKLVPWITEAAEDWEGFEENIGKATSTKCIAEQCRRSKIPCPPVKSRDGEDAFIEWEQTHGGQHKWIAALSCWRSINKLYGTFLVLKARLRSDGTMPYGIKYFGAHTGRWSGDGQFNMQNMNKEPIFCNEHGLMETNEKRIHAAIKCKHATGKWPEWVRYAIDVRALFLARPGKKMIASDLSQIEPRVLAYLAGDTQMLALMAKGMSPYEAHARLTMKWTGGKLKDEDPAKYSLAKARVLSLGYQAGWEKLIAMAWTNAGLDITVDDPEFETQVNPLTGEEKQIDGYGYVSRQTVKDFRASNPKICDTWKMLDGQFKGSVGGDFLMHLPSGRTMRYEKVRCEARLRPNKETGKPERSSVFTADVGGERVIFYGGKLTENLIQATARDVFGHHLLGIDDAGLDTLFGVHDEAVLEVDKDVEARDVEHLMSKCPEWLEGCPIGAEAKEIPHYLK